MTASTDRSLGRIIQTKRTARKMTQATLAKAAGYKGPSGAVTISRIENGAVLPPRSRLDNIALALGSTADELYQEAGLSPSVRDRLHGGMARLAAGEQAQINAALREEITLEATLQQTRTEETVRDLSAAHNRVVEEFLLPCIELTSRVEGIAVTAEPTEGLRFDAPAANVLQQQKSELRRQLIGAIGSVSAGTTAAAGIGAGIAYGTFAATAAWATASTGTAISTLSGAAATSATLAALGGGSLATGGLGVAAGTALLTGIVALPALVVAGVVAGRKRRDLVESAKHESAELRQIRLQQESLGRRLEQFWDWAYETQRLFDEIRVASAKPLGRLDAALERYLIDVGKTNVSYLDDLSPRERGYLDDLLNLASLVLSIQALPISALLEDLPPVDSRTVEEWIDLVLADAEQTMTETDVKYRSTTFRPS